MSNPGDAITKIVTACCKENPDMPSRTMARMLCRDDPACDAKGIDNMRMRIRRRRGTAGTQKRRSVKGCVPANDTRYIPPPLHDKKTPYVMPVIGDILWIGDLHVPYHEPLAINAMIDYCLANYKIKAVVFNGDTMDCFAISSFAKTIGGPTMQEEIDMTEDVVDVFSDAFPRAKLIWKDGNHEQRLCRYIARNAPELSDVIQNSPADLIRAKDRGIEYVGPLQLIKSGKLMVVHGGEVNCNSGAVNAARSLWLRTKTTALCHHLHNTSQHGEKSIDGTTHTCWSVGCLSDLQPNYNPHANKYNWGFAVQGLKKDGGFRIDNKRILKSGEVV